MIPLHLIPETPPDGPPWACAEIRLLRPYRHTSLANRLKVTLGCTLEGEKPAVVILQRDGPVGAKLPDIELCSAIKAIGAKIIYDLDDDLLARIRARQSSGISKKCARKCASSYEKPMQ